REPVPKPLSPFLGHGRREPVPKPLSPALPRWRRGVRRCHGPYFAAQKQPEHDRNEHKHNPSRAAKVGARQVGHGAPTPLFWRGGAHDAHFLRSGVGDETLERHQPPILAHRYDPNGRSPHPNRRWPRRVGFVKYRREVLLKESVLVSFLDQMKHGGVVIP